MYVSSLMGSGPKKQECPGIPAACWRILETIPISSLYMTVTALLEERPVKLQMTTFRLRYRKVQGKVT